MTLDTDWAAQAACRSTDPDSLFVQGAAQNRAKAICVGCVVRTECLADALGTRGAQGDLAGDEQAVAVLNAAGPLSDHVEEVTVPCHVRCCATGPTTPRCSWCR